MVALLNLPAKQRRAGQVVPVRSAAVVTAMKTRAKQFLRQPSVVATATVATAAVAEVGLHLLTHGKLTPSKVVTGLARSASSAPGSASVSTTVTEVITITKKIHTTRG